MEFPSLSCWLGVPWQCDVTRWEREGMASRGESGCWRGTVRYSGTEGDGGRREEEGDNRRIEGRWLEHRGGRRRVRDEKRRNGAQSRHHVSDGLWSVLCRTRFGDSIHCPLSPGIPTDAQDHPDSEATISSGFPTAALPGMDRRSCSAGIPSVVSEAVPAKRNGPRPAGVRHKIVTQ